MRGSKKMKMMVSRNGKLLGGFVPMPIVDGIRIWIGRSPERDISTFIREAAREKLRRDGISFNENARGTRNG